jgi:predicted DNA-binding protein (MmcQ/YjbR family)
MNASPLPALRDLCLALPEVTEKLSHGEPTWFGGKRTFVMYADRHHDQRVAFWCAAPDGAQELLVRLAPEKFFRPPYVGVRGWLGVYLDVAVDWDEIADLVLDAYRQIATPRMRAKLHAQVQAEGAGDR